MSQLKILKDEEGWRRSELFDEPIEEVHKQLREQQRRKIQTARIRKEISKEKPEF